MELTYSVIVLLTVSFKLSDVSLILSSISSGAGVQSVALLPNSIFGSYKYRIDYELNFSFRVSDTAINVVSILVHS